MLNFSQSISSAFKCNKQKPSLPIPLSFKIAQPKLNKISKEMTTQQSISAHSDTANSIFHKNMSKSYSKQRLEDQYISFKLKPAKKSEKGYERHNPVQITKQKPHAVPNRQVPNFYFASFEQSKEYQKKNSMSELSKSPQFFCKPNSEDSIKESFAEEKPQQAKTQYNKKPHYDENSFCKLMNESQEFQGIKKYQFPAKEFQNQNHKKQLKIDLDSEGSVIEDNFQDFKLFTPYKELKEEFERQDKLYEKQMKITQLQQFDSFSQRQHLQPVNPLPYNFKNHNACFEAGSKKIINKMAEDLRGKSKNHVPQSTDKKSFFFLTNPGIESFHNPPNRSRDHHCQDFLKQKESQQKNVQEFCFSLSSIKLATESSVEQPYNSKNLFSNSNDQLTLFDSKNCSRNFGSFGGSKKVHIRQLVEDFVDQLQNLDERSLNQKNVHQLEDVLESIVFKESKTRRQTIYIQEETHSARPRSRSPVIEEQTKKWQKKKRQNSSDIATERKAISEFQNFDYKMQRQKGQSRYAFTMNSSQKKSDRQALKSLQSNNMSPTGKENNKKQSVYKPNFAMCKSRERKTSQDKQKENQRTCTSFTNIKQKQQVNPLNINSKSSVYVKKATKSGRQNLRTESNVTPSRWRVY